ELDIRESESLTGEWSRALAAQEDLVNVIKVPVSQLPVGSGKTKVSRLEARTKTDLDSLTESDIETLGLSTYNQMNKKDNIAKASKYVVENTEDAIKVLKGEKEPPSGILVNSIYI